jgi:hypothetical protein
MSINLTAGSKESMHLRAFVRPNINVYFDSTNKVRIHSNSYFKQRTTSFNYKSNMRRNNRKRNNYKVLEISMN